ncbi:MAG: hypothetical protein J6P87_10110 [Lachnospiraceae bacterium]|nr:hypothetical protein [Lachnospiraceae bacterium]
MKYRLCFYAFVLAAMALLMVICRHEYLFTDTEPSVFIRPFRRIAVRLYRYGRMKASGSRFRRIRKWGRQSADRISLDLVTLYPGNDHSLRLMDHEVSKLTNFLLFVFLAAFMALCAAAAVLSAEEDFAGGRLFRNGYSESAKSIKVSEENHGDFVVEVAPREYTQEEAAKLAETVFDKLPCLMTGQEEAAGKDVLTVSSSLSFPSRVQDIPFLISWDSSRYGVIETDGTVHPPPEGEEKVTVTAALHYTGMKFEKEYTVLVVPAVPDEAEAERAVIEEAVSAAEKDSRQQESFAMPDRAGGMELVWSRKRDDPSLLLFVCMLTAGVAAWFGADRDIYRRIRDREREMAMDYPQILSKLVLYIGAGMSVRNAFVKLGQNYLAAQAKGSAGGIRSSGAQTVRRRYAYEEILLVCRELESGVPEGKAYAHFGKDAG